MPNFLVTFYFKTVKLLEMEKILNNKIVESFVTALSVVVIFCFISVLWVNSQYKNPNIIEQGKPVLSKYHGKVYNIFFHSLIVYPELAFDGNINSDLYNNQTEPDRPNAVALNKRNGNMEEPQDPTDKIDKSDRARRSNNT